MSAMNESREQTRVQRTWQAAMVMMVALVASSCVYRGGPVVADAVSGVVRGTVIARDATTLPDDAILEVWLSDVTRGSVGGAPVAQTTLVAAGRRLPIAFELRYDPARLFPDREYSIDAAIRGGGRTLLTTGSAYRVLNPGESSPIELSVHPPPLP
jgi:putative lipoprotein